jgi:SRSO17 transposase
VVGVYGAYVGRDDAAALVGAELFLPREWVQDRERRKQVEVPAEVSYRSQPTIARQMLQRLAPQLPFRWVLGDDEFGRTQAFRDDIRALSKGYVLDVPRNTMVRRVRKGTTGRLERKQWKVEHLRRQIPVADWSHFHVRDGEKGPIEVRATMLPVATRRVGKPWVHETLVIIETLDGAERWYCLAYSPVDVPLSTYVRQAGLRHRIEETFEEAKGEVGLDHFETRTWQGWNHHMALCQLALWFLLREKRRLGKKSTRPDHQHDPPRDRAAPVPRHSRAMRPHPELPPQTKRGDAPGPLSVTRPARTSQARSHLTRASAHLFQ